MDKRTIIVEFGQHKIVFEQDIKPANGGSMTTTMKSSTLIDHPSHYMDDSKARLVHAIVAQHINYGVDVTSAQYCNGLLKGIIWYLFHESK